MMPQIIGIFTLLALAHPPNSTAPCSVQALRYNSINMPAFVTFDVALKGNCKNVSVRIQFASSIGGVYPVVPITLNSARPHYLHSGNPEWWYPVKVTPYGPVRIAIKEGQ